LFLVGLRERYHLALEDVHGHGEWCAGAPSFQTKNIYCVEVKTGQVLWEAPHKDGIYRYDFRTK
jgi:hypothetical protein